MATKEKIRKARPSVDTKLAENDMVAAHPQLNELLVNSLRDLYWAENHLVKALPKMVAAAPSKKLQEALNVHLDITRGHVSRIEQAFNLMGQKNIARKCDAMEGLVLEGEGVVEDTLEDSPARELGVNMACQKVEYYEIIAYTGAINLANSLGLTEVADLLTETLQEERESADLLAAIGSATTEQALSEIQSN